MADTTERDRKQELALHDRVELAVKDRNSQIVLGADPDPNVGTGFYPPTDPQEIRHAALVERLKGARAAKAEKAEKAKGGK